MDDLIRRTDALNLNSVITVRRADTKGRKCDDEIIKACFEAYAEHIKKLPSADAVSGESYIKAVGYVKWLEKLIVDSETFEWLCEEATDEEWCEKNCNYSSIQAECLRHLYEVSKGGDTE